MGTGRAGALGARSRPLMSPAVGPGCSNATQGGMNSAEQLRQGAQQGPGFPAVPLGAKAGCSTHTGRDTGRGAGMQWCGVQSSHLAAARAGRGLRGSGPWPLRWEARSPARSCCCPGAGRTWDHLKRFLSGLDSPRSPCSDTQRRQRPRAGDLLEAVGSTHPDEVFL